MPVYHRRKIICAFAEAEPRPWPPHIRKPCKSRKDMTEAEKASVDEERSQRAAAKRKKAEREATLTPWTKVITHAWPPKTVAMYKSDAKSQFGLTEAEILTLPHESIMAGSSKTFFRVRDVMALAKRKDDAGVPRHGFCFSEPLYPLARVFDKSNYKPKMRTRKNWDVVSDGDPISAWYLDFIIEREE